MTILIPTFISFLIFIFASIILISTILNCRNYKKYKYSYELLTSGEYQFNWISGNLYFFSPKDLVGKYSSIAKNSNLSIVFFLDKKDKVSSIRLAPLDHSLSFIHSGFIAMDPYTVSYRKKFVEWFEANRAEFKVRTPHQFEFNEEELEELLKVENN
jgi:hypothetical protein